MAFPKKPKGNDSVVINPPQFELVRIPIIGTSNYVMNAFSQEAKVMMENAQMLGSVDKPSRTKRPPKDFEAAYKGSMHVSTDGWHGIPVIAFRAAMVRASSLIGIEMTRAKMCMFVECDGYDSQGQGLVKITHGRPEMFTAPVRNDNGSIDIRARARFAPGWRATVTLKFDAEFLSKSSIINLLERAGTQVGVGAGRPFSTKSVGQSWGTFAVKADQDSKRRDEAAE